MAETFDLKAGLLMLAITFDGIDGSFPARPTCSLIMLGVSLILSAQDGWSDVERIG